MPDLDPEELIVSRFSSFAAAPPVALPGAVAAQARGAQRNRRTRAALAGAGSLLVVLAVTAGVALGAGGEADRVRPLPADPGPTSQPTQEGLSVSLLDPEDVAAVRPGDWAVRGQDDLPFDPLPGGCGDPGDVFGTPVETTLRFLDGPETVGHSLKAYPDQAQAQVAFGRVIEAIEACGETSDGPQIVAGAPVSTSTRGYGTLSAGTRTVVFAIERIGAVLSGVAIVSFELDDIVPLADAAASEVQSGPYAAPDPAMEEASADTGSGLLRPQDVAAVEPGDWTAMDLQSDRPQLAVCGRALDPRPLEVAGVDLRVEREAGGTFVYQEAYRYASAEQAATALSATREAVEACPSEPIVAGDQDELDPGSRGTTSYEVVRTTPGLLLVRTNTQCETCPPSYGYSVTVLVGTRVTAFSVAVAEDGGTSLGLALQYAEAAAERLRGATGS